MLNEQLQKQIEQEAKAGQHTYPGTDYGHGFNKGYDSGYKFAGEKYAEKWQEAEADRIAVTLERDLLKLENQRLRSTIEEIHQQIISLRKEIVDMLTSKTSTDE